MTEASGVVLLCGQCVDFTIDALFPFLKPFFLVFVGWFTLGITQKIISWIVKSPIPFTINHKFFLALFGMIALSMMMMGSGLVPVLLILLPVWLTAMKRFHTQLEPALARPKMQQVFATFQIGIAGLLMCIFAYSYLTIRSTSRLIEKTAHSQFQSKPFERALVSKGSAALPELMSVVERADLSNYRSQNQLAACLRVLREIGDPQAAPIVANFLLTTPFKPDLYTTEVWAEAAQTLTSLDKKLATPVLQLTLPQLQRQVSKKDYFGIEALIGVFLKCLIETQDREAIRKQLTPEMIEFIFEHFDYEQSFTNKPVFREILQALGSPYFKDSVELNREWWHNSGKATVLRQF